MSANGCPATVRDETMLSDYLKSIFQTYGRMAMALARTTIVQLVIDECYPEIEKKVIAL